MVHSARLKQLHEDAIRQASALCYCVHQSHRIPSMVVLEQFEQWYQ